MDANRFVQSAGWPGLVKISPRWFSYSDYAHRVNASMMAAQDAMMQALETGSQTVQ